LDDPVQGKLARCSIFLRSLLYADLLQSTAHIGPNLFGQMAPDSRPNKVIDLKRREVWKASNARRF
jgi:hypothetical protein